VIGTLQDRLSPTDARPLPSAPRFEDGRRARIGTSTHDGDPGAVRHRRAQDLIELTGCQREPLERLRSGYQQRLHRASDDFDATDGLRVVELALTLVPTPDGPWTAQY
jgi:hypothetical protein